MHKIGLLGLMSLFILAACTTVPMDEYAHLKQDGGESSAGYYDLELERKKRDYEERIARQRQDQQKNQQLKRTE